MVKVAWKTINGYGPYAYLQKSVKKGGKVTSKHIAYLGAAGPGKDGIALVPGKNFNAPAAEGFAGGRLRIPLVGDETEAKLKPKQKAAVEFMEKQAKAGVPTNKIIAGLKALPEKLKKRVSKKPKPVGATPKSIKAVAEAADKPVAGATPAGAKAAAKAAAKPPAGATPAAAKLAGSKTAAQQQQLTEGPKVKAIFFDNKGVQIVPDASIDKLEAAAAKAVLALDPNGKTIGDVTNKAMKDFDAEAETIEDAIQTTVGKSGISTAQLILEEQIIKAAAHQVLDGGTAVGYFDTAAAKKHAKKSAELVTVLEHPPAKSETTSPAKSPRVTVSGAAPNVTNIPTGYKGEELISQADVEELENAAAKGLDELVSASKTIADKQKLASQRAAVLKVASDLKVQIGAEPPKLLNLPKDYKGKAYISDTNIEKLEEAAATGVAVLEATGKSMANKLKTPYKKTAILNAVKDLKGQIAVAPKSDEPVQQSTPAPAAPAIANVPLKNNGKPAISKANIKKLEAAAAQGVDELDAATKTITDKLLSSYNKAAVLNASASLKTQIQGSPTAGSLMDTEKKALIQQATSVLKDKIEAASVQESAGGPANPSKPLKAAAGSGPPKVDPTAHPQVSKANIKKLEAAAAKGVEELDDTAKALVAGLKLTKKKAAVLSASWSLRTQIFGLQEGDGGSGLSQTMDDVDDGKLKLPKQETPSLKVMQQQEQILKAGNKNYNADLVQVSGKKGSNEGGLFKDKKLETLHYVKWPNSAARAKVEALTALLYAYADVPAPTVRVIKFQDKDAVMSDWIDDATTMTWDEIIKHKDVREGFAVDAWLANWDVVGLQADNLVKGPGDKAYRIDVGGSMLFRAQGKPKEFPAHVPELESMRNAGIAPQAAKAFKKLTPTQLRNSVKKVAGVTDAHIDAAVDSVKLPKKSADYPVSQFGKEANDLPTMLKARLKARRDWLVEEVLEAEKKQAATITKLQEQSDLKPASVKAIVGKATKYSATSPAASSKWALTNQVMRSELGKAQGEEAGKQTKEHYNSWKGTTTTSKGAMLRWAAGAMTGDGRRELRRLEKFNNFLVKEKQMTKKKAQEHAKHLEKLTAGENAAQLVEGLEVTNKQNDVIISIKNPGKETVTVYRGWKPPQLKYLGTQHAKVGDTVPLDDPPLYSWSLTPNVAKNFGGGHGSYVTKAEVPIDKIILSDVANSTGLYASEDEVLFKGIKKLEMEVIKSY